MNIQYIPNTQVCTCGDFTLGIVVVVVVVIIMVIIISIISISIIIIIIIIIIKNHKKVISQFTNDCRHLKALLPPDMLLLNYKVLIF